MTSTTVIELFQPMDYQASVDLKSHRIDYDIRKMFLTMMKFAKVIWIYLQDTARLKSLPIWVFPRLRYDNQPVVFRDPKKPVESSKTGNGEDHSHPSLFLL